jgi:hypothetical protein
MYWYALVGMELVYVKYTSDKCSVTMKSKRSPHEALHGTHLHELIVSII